MKSKATRRKAPLKKAAVPKKPEAFRVFLAAERMRWVELVKETGIKVH